MNVLYIIHHAGRGGTERYVLSVATALRDRGIVKPYFMYTQEGLLSERMMASGVPCVQMPLPGRYSLRAARRVAHFCRRHRIELIHTHFLRENYIALLSRLFYRTPRVVYTNHLILPNDLPTRLSNRLLSRAQAAVLAGCAAGTEQLLRNGIPRRVIRVIHNGVHPGDWTGGDRQALRRELGLSEDTVALLYSARLTGGKGHAFLLRAIARLRELTNRPFCLLLAGDGELAEDIRTRAEGLPVLFLGFREDMPSVLAASDVCVNASESETICMSILEGMAAGLPVVATKVGGTGDILTDGEGLLVPYGDTEAMAAALKRMIREPKLRQCCAEAALRAANGRFHRDRMLSDIESIYQGAVPNGKSGKETHSL